MVTPIAMKSLFRNRSVGCALGHRRTVILNQK